MSSPRSHEGSKSQLKGCLSDKQRRDLDLHFWLFLQIGCPSILGSFGLILGRFRANIVSRTISLFL